MAKAPNLSLTRLLYEVIEMSKPAYQQFENGESPMQAIGYSLVDSLQVFRAYKESQFGQGKADRLLSGFPDGRDLLNQMGENGRKKALPHPAPGDKPLPAPGSSANPGVMPEQKMPGIEPNIGDRPRATEEIRNRLDPGSSGGSSGGSRRPFLDPDLRNHSVVPGSADDISISGGAEVSREKIERAIALADATTGHRADSQSVQKSLALQDVSRSKKLNAGLSVGSFPQALPNRSGVFEES